MKRLRDLLTPLSLLRYLAWRAFPAGRQVTVRLRTGERFSLRPEPAEDLATAFELFVAEVYQPPFQVHPGDTYRIVDVGANCGYSTLFWGASYPKADIIAFEPHPVHLRMLEHNVALNRRSDNLALRGLSERLTLHRAAAGTHNGHIELLDAESRSSTVDVPSDKALKVPLVDFFEAVGTGPIDLLKMDIEGGEYALLSDPRFARLPIRALVMEWHRTSERPDGKAWCERTLAELGYEVTPGLWTGEVNGLLWARRKEAQG